MSKVDKNMYTETKEGYERREEESCNNSKGLFYTSR